VPFAKKESPGFPGASKSKRQCPTSSAADAKVAALIRFDSSDALMLIPLAMSSDDEWHEVRAAKIRPERTGAEQFAVLAMRRCHSENSRGV
jgi:hypothetical protein